jgi:hypothetical protein
MRQMRHLLVIQGAPEWHSHLLRKVHDVLHGKRVLGYVYHGGKIQARLKNRYMTRFYSERITTREATPSAGVAG